MRCFWRIPEQDFFYFWVINKALSDKGELKAECLFVENPVLEPDTYSNARVLVGKHPRGTFFL